MRKLQKSPVEKTKTSKKEPLAEGLQVIVPTDSSGRRLWSKMSDEQIFRFAQKVMEEQGITGRHELEKADPGLYRILSRRGLLEEIVFEEKHRSWKDMSNDEIVGYAKKVMEEKRITGRKDLKKADPGLYLVLRERVLLDEVGFQDKQRSWKSVSNEEIVELAKKVMEEKRITGRKDLKKADHGLYNILIRRGLVKEIEFDGKRKNWKDMSDEKIVEFAREIIGENSISRRSELSKADPRLYSVLKRRGLVDLTFARIDQQKYDQARDAVIDALDAFAANDNASAEDDVA